MIGQLQPQQRHPADRGYVGSILLLFIVYCALVYGVIRGVRAVLASNEAAPVAQQLEGVPGGKLVPVPQDSLGGDTLLASPWIQNTFDNWRGTPVRFWCITSYASWPHFLFVRHMYETSADAKCATGIPVFVMAPECPVGGITAPEVPFIIVECGDRRFRRYDNSAVARPPIAITPLERA